MSDSAKRKIPDELKAPDNPNNKITKVIGVMSGKGGVGKSLITSMLAIMARSKGNRVGILDADITGPSIPKMFGLKGHAATNDLGIMPEISGSGIKIMSINLLLENEETPVIWRGPILAKVIKQFWSDVLWEELDYLFIDMPPGTGDVPLTVFQSLPIDGVVIATSPQDLVSLIVKKAYNMTKQMDIPVLGLVENMAYFKCPDCGAKHEIYGHSRLDEIAGSLGVEVLGRIPLDPQIADYADKGQIELVDIESIVRAEKILK
jgi:Mrp family chromosome partitioning ATPase